MEVNKYSHFSMLQGEKQDKTGQNDRQSATYTKPVGVWWPPFSPRMGPEWGTGSRYDTRCAGWTRLRKQLFTVHFGVSVPGRAPCAMPTHKSIKSGVRSPGGKGTYPAVVADSRQNLRRHAKLAVIYACVACSHLRSSSSVC